MQGKSPLHMYITGVIFLHLHSMTPSFAQSLLIKLANQHLHESAAYSVFLLLLPRPWSFSEVGLPWEEVILALLLFCPCNSCAAQLYSLPADKDFCRLGRNIQQLGGCEAQSQQQQQQQ